jgi:hypothetical protein
VDQRVDTNFQLFAPSRWLHTRTLDWPRGFLWHVQLYVPLRTERNGQSVNVLAEQPLCPGKVSTFQLNSPCVQEKCQRFSWTSPVSRKGVNVSAGQPLCPGKVSTFQLNSPCVQEKCQRFSWTAPVSRKSVNVSAGQPLCPGKVSTFLLDSPCVQEKCQRFSWTAAVCRKSFVRQSIIARIVTLK